jgi:hypothetical protein
MLYPIERVPGTHAFECQAEALTSKAELKSAFTRGIWWISNALPTHLSAFRRAQSQPTVERTGLRAFGKPGAQPWETLEKIRAPSGATQITGIHLRDHIEFRVSPKAQ